MLPVGAGPVGEHEDLLGCPELAQRFQSVGDRHSRRALERHRPGVTRRERGVKLGQPVEPIGGVEAVGSAGGDDRPQRRLLIGKSLADRGLDLAVSA